MMFPEDRLPGAAESCSTPFGVLYRPRSFGIQTREKLEELVVRAQRAAWSFLLVSVAVGLICGTLAQLLETQNGKLEQSVIVGTGCIFWGWILGSLGRRGYLPLPEAD